MLRLTTVVVVEIAARTFAQACRTPVTPSGIVHNLCTMNSRSSAAIVGS